MKFLKYISAIFLAFTLISTLGCESTSERRSAGEYVDDTMITAKVKKAIIDEPTLKAAEINVETYNGVVQLSGFVSSKDDIRTAVEVARGVKGVTSVKNDMRVKPGN
ncbi:MAG TPA: BON domain-containing protein [Methylophilaceae bacterium]|jgi:osmotically-inducible protein OsmY|nr:BON domain-containing protein [Methylophilaceae bacterium]